MRVSEDDDVLPRLPEPLGELGEDDPIAGDDLALDDPIGETESESVGLDDASGLEEESPLFTLELPPGLAAADEEVDAIPIEGLDGDDEYGWTEAASTEDEPWDAPEIDLPDLGTDDGGEEGVDDAVDLAHGDDATHLPPMREGDDDGTADDLSMGEDAMIEAAVTSFEAERHRAGALLPARLDEVRVEHLGPDGPVFCIAQGAPLVAGGRGLYGVETRCEPMPCTGLDDLEILAVAIDPEVRDRLVVGTRSGRLLRTEDGRRFAPAGLALGTAGRMIARERGGRLWACEQSGALHRSDDFGATFTGPLLLKPVVAIAAPDDGGVICVCAGADAPSQLARSDDGGGRWAATDGPPLAGGAIAVAALRDFVAVTCDADPRGPLLSSDRGKSWTRVPGLPATGPIALAWEPGGLALYAAHTLEGGRAVVVRHRPFGGDSALVLEVEDDAPAASPDLRVHALSAERAGRFTVLHAATGAGLFRVIVDTERAS